MTEKTRTILFLACLLAFLIVSPSVILYGQGYRLNFKTWKITKTGAFYFKALPKNSEIYIDGKLKAKTDFFFGSNLVENLLPGKYSVEIRKPEYSSWKKNLGIEPMMTTEAKNIILFPQKIDFQSLASGIQTFFPSPLFKKTILEKKDSQGWYLTLFDYKNNLEEVLVREKDLKKGTAFMDLQWSNETASAILKTSLGERERFFLINLEKKPIAPVSLDYLGIFEKISFDSRNSQRFFILKNGVLSSGSFDSKQLTKIADQVVDFTSEEGKLYFLESTGFVFTVEDPLSLEKISETQFEIKAETFSEFAVFKSNLFLKQEDVLFWFDEKEKSFIQVADNIKGFSVSQDQTKLVFFNNAEIWIYFLRERLDQPPQKQGEKILLTRLSEGISQVFWLNNNYLLFAGNNKLRIIETDGRDKANSLDIGEFKNPEIFFDRTTKKTSVLSQGNLFISSQILP